MSDLTYAQLDAALRSLGFEMKGILDNNKIYSHADSGAFISFPVFPDGEPVHDRYRGLVRVVLKTFDLANPIDFASKPVA